MDKGIIFNIQKFCAHDGPGIRTTIFLKGCHMRCRWCCNPEGLRLEPEDMLQINRIGDKEFSKKVTVGREYTVAQVMREILKDRQFYEESGGGVTFSGGEPMVQADFLFEILKECKREGIHTAIETDGHAKMEDYVRMIVADCVDLWLFDVKHYDSDKHKRFTGVGTKLITSNLRHLVYSGQNIRYRMAVIPTFNESNEDIHHIASCLHSIHTVNLKPRHMDLFAYHTLGVGKYAKLDIVYPMPTDIISPTPERMKWIKSVFETIPLLAVHY